MKMASAFLIILASTLTTTICAQTDSEPSEQTHDTSQAEKDKSCDKELDRIRIECDLRADIERAF